MQQQIDFNIHTVENNPSSKAILDNNTLHFSKQCRVIYEALQRGERLTVCDAMINYGIGDLRRRVKDLKDHNGVDVKFRFLNDGRTKEWFI